jgi:hypothetical protein
LVGEPCDGKHFGKRLIHSAEQRHDTDHDYRHGEKLFHRPGNRQLDFASFADSQRQSGDGNRSAFWNTTVFRSEPAFGRQRHVVD